MHHRFLPSRQRQGLLLCPLPTPPVLSLPCRCWGTVSRARLHNEISRLKRAAGDTKQSLCPAVLGHLHPDLGPHGCCRNRTSRILHGWLPETTSRSFTGTASNKTLAIPQIAHSLWIKRKTGSKPMLFSLKTCTLEAYCARCLCHLSSERT